MMLTSYKHYVRLNKNNFVVKGFSKLFEEPLETDTCINEEGGGHFELNGIINPSLIHLDGFPKYKYVDGEIIETTKEEHQTYLSNLPAPKPTATEVMAKQITILMSENAEKEEQLRLLANQVTELMLGGM